MILMKRHWATSLKGHSASKIKGLFSVIHTSNPCGLPRLSFICFHVTRISETDTLVALTSVGAAVGSVGRKVEMMNHSPYIISVNTVPGSLSCSCLPDLFFNDTLWSCEKERDQKVIYLGFWVGSTDTRILPITSEKSRMMRAEDFILKSGRAFLRKVKDLTSAAWQSSLPTKTVSQDWLVCLFIYLINWFWG